MMFREGGSASNKKKFGQILKSSLNPRKYSREDMAKTRPGNGHHYYRHKHENSAEAKLYTTTFSNYKTAYLKSVFKLNLNNQSLSSHIQPAKVFSFKV
jgi:hypothetical protein